MTSMKNKIVEEFTGIYNREPEVLIRAPGRVNIIGEHTDYNDGFVLPMAIEQAIWLALSPRDDSTIEVHSADYKQTAAFNLEKFEHSKPRWAEYVKGVIWALQEEGHSPQGWQGVFSGDIPVGAGLSSSAALELAVARGTAQVSNIEWKPLDMALLCQNAERNWVGVNCGIMDQLISACGEEGKAMLIDCRSLETNYAPLPDEATLFVLDTNTRRGLVDSAYNQRREECEQAARHFKVPALRDVSYAQLVSAQSELSEEIFNRARHVITENRRTQQALRAIVKRDPVKLGELLTESHESLRDYYEVSSEELNIMVRIALEEQGCYGARMTGAGFGGCAIALVHTDQSAQFQKQVYENYQRQTGLEPMIFPTVASQGTEVIS